jgi:hypothetical protein
MKTAKNAPKYSRKEFLQMCAGGTALLAIGLAAPQDAEPEPVKDAQATKSGAEPVYDLREFVRWIEEDFEPSIRLSGGAGRYARQPGQTTPALYGVADMADVLYAIGALHPSTKEREEWADAFELFQNPLTGWFREKDPVTLSPEHNTAFALGAMRLLDIAPRYAVRTEAKYEDPRAFLQTLDWRKSVYSGSHRGAGIGSIYTLVPALHSTQWFSQYFGACDDLFEPSNGLMGQDKPASGDIDQVGGTFHYAFLYQYFNRHMPYPEKRIDSVLGLQQQDGYWDRKNHLWMTLDAIFLMTRTLRYCAHRLDDVRASVRKALDALSQDVYSPEGRKKTFSSIAGVHSLTAATAIAAEAQQFLGGKEIVTDWPLKLVLDRRPFI